ncbi:MAG: peroxide stress protein YaaA [Brachybacterium sp.]|nr:peroxide stress protein YaaA [Brachybacterium sp.]
MLILLPPSETKTRPDASRDVLDLATVAFPALTEARSTMLRAAQRTAATRDGAAKLGVPASSPELTERMAHLEAEPVGAALEVYAGVLFDQLDPATAIAPDRRVLIQSALLGVVDAACDRIPAYRLSAGSTVSRLGTVGTWWAPRLRRVASDLQRELADSTSPVVIDCRSGAYRSMMPLRSSSAVQVLDVSPVQEQDGRRKVISHDAKRYRGWVTRVLLDAPTPPSTPDEVVDQLRAAFDATLGVELDGHRLVIIDRVS